MDKVAIFARVLFCGGPDVLILKLTLLQNAIQLGAKSSSALTDKVTHLICEAPGSQKYSVSRAGNSQFVFTQSYSLNHNSFQYCISHGIPVMKSSWIHDLHAKWLSGELVSAESVSTHEYDSSVGSYICM